MLVVVVYDVANNCRRRKIANEVENFGTRVQYSVFECHLTEKQAVELERRVQKLLEPLEDQVRYYRVCTRDRRQILIDGGSGLTRDWRFMVV